MTDIKLNAKKVWVLTVDGWTLWSGKYKSVLRGYGLWTYIEDPDSKPPADIAKADEWTQMSDMNAKFATVSFQKVKVVQAQLQHWMYCCRKPVFTRD